MDFGRIAAILKRRLWLLLACIVATMALTWGMTRLTGSRWLATVTFLVPSESPLTNPTKDKSETPVLDAKGQAQVYASIARSQEVLGRALKKVKIAPPRDLIQHIDFESNGARLYELKVTDSNPSRAEQLANSIAETFIEENHRLNTLDARNNVTLLEGQLKEREAKLEQARKAYVDYCEKNGIKGDTASNQIVMAQRRLEAAQTDYETVKERIDANTSRLKNIQAQTGKIPAEIKLERPVSQRQDVILAERSVFDAKQQLLKLQSRYTGKNPSVIAAKEALQQAQDQYDTASNKREFNLQSNPLLSSLQIEEKNLEAQIQADRSMLSNEQGTMTEASQEITRLSKANSPLGSLATAVAAETDGRTAMWSRVNAAKMQLDVAGQQKSLVILERVNASNPPVNSSAGRTVKLMILAALCAAIVLSGILIAMESGDNRLKSVEGAESLLGIPVLASIPPPQGSVSALSLVRAAELHPLSPHAEAFRFLGRHFLHLHSGQPLPRSIMVLSAKAKQGNTNTAVNLAITLAQSGHRVILVDGNTRTPSLHEIFELENTVGLTKVLLHPSEEAVSAALCPTNLPNLMVLPSGPPSENPWELFSTQSVGALSENLLGRADYVIYDTPSALAYTDAMNLGEVADVALMCLRVSDRLSGQEGRVVQMFQMQRVHVAGSVLKDVPASFLQESQHLPSEPMRFVEAGTELVPPFAIEASGSNLPVSRSGSLSTSRTEEVSEVPSAVPLTVEDLRSILTEALREKASSSSAASEAVPLTASTEENPVTGAQTPAETLGEKDLLEVSPSLESPLVRPASAAEEAQDEEREMQTRFQNPDSAHDFPATAVNDALHSRVQEAFSRVEALEKQLSDRNQENDRLHEETLHLTEALESSQKRIAEIEVRESAAAASIMHTEQRRVSVEQELEKAKADAFAEVEQIREKARQEAEAIVLDAKKQLAEAQAIGTTYLAQAEQVKQQAHLEAEATLQDARNNAEALKAHLQDTAEADAEKIRSEARLEAEMLLSDAARQTEEVHQKVTAVYEEHLKSLGDDIVTKLRESIQTQLNQLPHGSPQTSRMLPHFRNGNHSIGVEAAAGFHNDAHPLGDLTNPGQSS